MNIRDLKYLAALSEHRHFGKAAEACFVSQPALSMQIKKLEDELEVKLVERTNKTVVLTEVGHRIAEQARLVLQNVDQLHTTAKLAKDPFIGPLKLGIIPTLAPYLLPHVISTLVQRFPKIAFYLIEEKSLVLKEKIKAGELDAAILATSIGDTKFSKASLLEEEFLLAVSVNHALAKRKMVSYQNLKNHSCLLLEKGHCLREQVLAIYEKSNVIEIQNFQVTSLEMLRHMVIANIGITFIPRLACKKHKGISYIPFSAQKPKRLIECYWRATNPKAQVINAVVDEIKSIMGKA